MKVAGEQVQTFLSTLQGYSVSCAQSRKVVEETLCNVEKVEKDIGKNNKKLLTHVKKIKTDVMNMVSKHETAVNEMKREIATVKERASVVEERYVEVMGALEPIEVKETFVCSLADVTKESERLMRRLYTRSLYAGTICREIASIAFDTLEAVIRIVQAQIPLLNRLSVDNDSMMDGVSEGLSSNSAQPSIGDLVKRKLFKTRYLRTDIQTVERSAEMMEDAGLFDSTLSVVTGELNRVCLDADDLTEQRRRMEGMVKRSMPYDAKKHGSHSQYDGIVAE